MGGIPLFSAFHYLFSKLSVDANKMLSFRVDKEIILYVDHVVPPTHFTCRVIGASMILQPHLKKTTQNKKTTTTTITTTTTKQNKTKQKTTKQNKKKKKTAQLWLYKRQL